MIEVLVSEDGLTGFIKISKQEEEPIEITKEVLMDALILNHIKFGIKEETVEKLALRPIYNLKIEIAKGVIPINGEDGKVNYFVKKDLEYKPEYTLEGVVDYKNLDYFQFVKKDQILCGIIKETLGTDGMNIHGGIVAARNGRPPGYPVGKNTRLIENDTLLIATCDGVIHYVRDTIDVNDLLKISSSLDQHTGNINFTGDVTIDGDVCNGFSVKSGGNIIVRGVVEDSTIEAQGNLHVSKGINGALNKTIKVMGNLKCNYIENAVVYVEGDIIADYIIDSKIVCMGNIELSGANQLVLGGEIKVKGELKAKDIGSEKERMTRIEVIGIKIIDTLQLEKLYTERELYNTKALELLEKAKTITKIIELQNTEESRHQLALIKKQMLLIREKIAGGTNRINVLENNWTMEYTGAILCKRKIYQGVKIFFGAERFQFSFDNIEHCRIYSTDGEINQSTL